METKEKKQVVTAISKANNILITVGVDPTVDELSSLLGLSLLLAKLEKHATAVFSGKIPPAISFLEPDKTFENTVDGLRDFIIAINKEKADHLRYKLDGDVVKIFITPYKNTIIRDTDLEFSQGDFNVDLVIALGTESKTDIDAAVSAHGRILHDAATVAISFGATASELGEVNWQAPAASSLGEMIASLSRDLGENLIDGHIATALMTGIVSNTERFSNNLTTSEVMKTAATLMSLGANQQLIASRLEEAEEPTPAPAPKRNQSATPEPETQEEGNGTIEIAHDESGNSLPPLPDGASLPEVQTNDDSLQSELERVIPPAPAALQLEDLNEQETPQPVEAPVEPQVPAPEPTPQDAPEANVAPRRFVAKATADYEEMEQPTMGGTLNATTEQAEYDKRVSVEDDRNRVILSHDAPRAVSADELAAQQDQHDDHIAAQPQTAPPTPAEQPAPIEPTAPAAEQVDATDDALASLGYPAGSQPTLADLDQKTGHTQSPVEVDTARAAVANALDSVFSNANNPTQDLGSQPLGEDLHAPAPSTPVQAAPAPQPSTGIDLPPLPPLPPLPGQDGGLPPLPPLPQISELDAHADEHAAPADQGPTETDWTTHTVEPPVTHDPNQFHIPGQSK